MPNKSLKETNPYLKNPVTREKGLWSTVSTSSAIENVHVAKEKVILPHKPAKSEKSSR